MGSVGTIETGFRLCLELQVAAKETEFRRSVPASLDFRQFFSNAHGLFHRHLVENGALVDLRNINVVAFIELEDFVILVVFLHGSHLLACFLMAPQTRTDLQFQPSIIGIILFNLLKVMPM